MENQFEFEATVRAAGGTGVSRRLRRDNRVPAVLYGAGPALMLELDHNEVVKRLRNEAVYSHVLTVRIDGAPQQAILKEVQRHPYKPVVLHLDFQRVSKTGKVRVHVPLHFVNEDICAGVKKGGAVHHHLSDVEVTCLPDRLPEYIAVDLAEVEIGQILHLSNLSLPEGLELPALAQGADHDLAVVSVTGRVGAEEPAAEE